MNKDLKTTISRSYTRGKNPNSRNGWKKGHGFTAEQLKKMSLAKLGKSNSSSTKFKKGQFADDKHPFWKGKLSSYTAKHQWINRKLGKPDCCEFCGIDGLSGRKIHWANISKEYKHDISDWLRLCVPCHKKHDLGRNNNG